MNLNSNLDLTPNQTAWKPACWDGSPISISLEPSTRKRVTSHFECFWTSFGCSPEWSKMPFKVHKLTKASNRDPLSTQQTASRVRRRWTERWKATCRRPSASRKAISHSQLPSKCKRLCSLLICSLLICSAPLAVRTLFELCKLIKFAINNRCSVPNKQIALPFLSSPFSDDRPMKLFEWNLSNENLHMKLS